MSAPLAVGPSKSLGGDIAWPEVGPATQTCRRQVQSALRYCALVRPWTTAGRRTVLTYGRFLAVEEHVVRLPDGRTIPDWPWIITPSYAIVVAVTAEQVVLCFRQVKYAIPEASLALPGGYIEPDEEPLAAAQRELLEETGHTADTWKSLGSYVVDANRGAGNAHLFLATGAHKTREPDADDLEDQELVRLTLGELQEAVLGSEFKALSWAAAAGLALLHLRA